LSYCPRSSLPADVLAWLTGRLRRLLPPRPPGMGGNPPLALEVRLDAVAAVILDGAVVPTRRPDGRDLQDRGRRQHGPAAGQAGRAGVLPARRHLRRHPRRVARAPLGDGPLRRGGRGRRAGDPGARPSAWVNQKVLYDAKRHTHTAQGLAVSTIHGDLLWCDGGWPGSCHEQELIELSGLGNVLDADGVVTLLDRGFRGMAKRREHWHMPVGDRRTKDRLTGGQRAFNRCQAGLRALVEQAIGHLANAWSLRRWRGLLYRVRDVFRAACALVSLGRWLQRIPRDRASAAGG
jgi:DDE superfamily endonuclease